ncbi:FIG00731934: hypothetical protein [Klebsiella pneumoniae IS43]|uniref:PilZ domain-containing protein n=1 Tax=Klebsiella pneumoniae IS43 TaxID=1432552 RepID=W1DTR5_KLEPN|nr:FIG00731934: hypothetical protein [Klebsiella pneumoniae IS43]
MSMTFYCRGRHKNGENYLFDIKDISDGGCALMTKTPNLKIPQPQRLTEKTPY